MDQSRVERRTWQKERRMGFGIACNALLQDVGSRTRCQMIWKLAKGGIAIKTATDL